jgi:hypothetical protein
MLDDFAQKLMAYNTAHWGADHLPDEWRQYDFATILPRALADFTIGATRGRRFVRIAGQSGSGKTSQLLPAAEAFFASHEAQPVLIAARRFVEYHPYYEQILARFGAEHIRESTHEFTVTMMFLALKALIDDGYDLILDVTLLDPFIEQVLMQLLTAQQCQSRVLMVAVSKEISDQFITKRTARVVKNTTAAEFWRATRAALDFYVASYPDLPITVWSAFDLDPIYDGPIATSLPAIRKYQAIPAMPPAAPSEESLRQAKIQYFTVPAA